jgi:hypothetical protein
VVTIRAALAALDSEGARARRSIYLAVLAEALDASGSRDEALEALGEAERQVTRSGDRLWSSELARLRVSIVPPEQAPEQARRALQLARDLRARPLVLRSAVTLAATQPDDRAAAYSVVRAALATLPDSGSSFDRDRAMHLLASAD